MEKAIEIIRSSERKKSEGFNTLPTTEAVQNPFVLVDNESGEDSVEIQVSPAKLNNRRRRSSAASQESSSSQPASGEKLRSSTRYIKSEQTSRPNHSENDHQPSKKARILIDLCES